MRDEAQRVRRRRVFYIPGYDPVHPRRYRELYRSEGAAQAAISGYEIDQAPSPKGAPFGWTVTSTQDGATTEARVEVLVWSDIVKDSMETGIAGTYLQLVRTAWIYGATGALWRLMRLRKGPVIAALYPVAMLIGQLVLALLLAGVAAWGLAQIHPAAAIAALAVVPAVLGWFQRNDGRFLAYYLMHDYAYSAAHRGATPPPLEERLAHLRERVAQALTEDVDEVLIVGHSSGAHLGVSLLAGLFRAGAVPRDGPPLAFLSLGQVVPMVSFLPRAHDLRADLALVSARPDLTWVDVTAPGDGCAFALCDPVAVSGVAPHDQRGPLILSAAFSKTLAPERWEALKRRWFRLHFQYMCAFDLPRDYDYFRITAGPMTLADRFAGRGASPGRIATPVNRFTSVAA
ncbi:MAG: hypothetical protein ACU0CO_08730 [Shimia sp.]